MNIRTAKENFDSHIGAAISIIEYFSLVASTFPPLFTQVKFGESTKESILPWMDYLCRLHGRELYAGPPDPIPFNGATIPPEKLADVLYASIGRNHVLSDAVNAPFTRPLNTQIALISVNYAWDAYNTFIASVLGEHPKIEGKNSDWKLSHFGYLIPPFAWDDRYIELGKILRSSFAHHFALLAQKDTDRIVEMKISGFRLLGGGRFECDLFASKAIVEAIGKKVIHVCEHSGQ